MGIKGIDELKSSGPIPGYDGPPPNPFSTGKDVKEILGQLAGYASMCWENVSNAGVFDSESASRAVDQAYSRMEELAPLHHNDETLFKVQEALIHQGLNQTQIQDAINEMQNEGIYFREMKK